MVKLSAPSFWFRPQVKLWPAVLTPLAWAVARVARCRMQRKGWQAPVPVLCCGNLTVGGAGKTTVVIDLVQRLQARGVHPHVLTRGYGGKVPNGTQVMPAFHTARDVGDEPLLLARYCPVWVGGDRAATARRAVSAGADCLIMDDGFQNPSLEKTVSLVVVDGAVGLGNGHVLPAGPLRETVEDGLARTDALLIIGADRHDVERLAQSRNLPVLHAELEQVDAPEVLRSSLYVAFAGIGRPEKFFEGLRSAGIKVVEALPFPDHYAYNNRDIARLQAEASRLGARLVTTPKDAMRLPASFRQNVVVMNVRLVWRDPQAPECLLDTLLARQA